VAILNFSLGARPQNDFVVAGLANAYFIRGYYLQDLHRLAEAKEAIAQAMALSLKVLPESRNPSVSFTISGLFYNFPVTLRDPCF
jgi:2-phospho-L-lactate transferase/gluconeogenesis factor (CofD/UPF0052 family)